jgi:D-3-phosphoglycerate dehydrogenase
MAFKVLIADHLAAEGLDIFSKGTNVEVVDRAGITKPELLAIVGDFDALVVRSATKVDPEVVAAGKRLKVIGRAGIGVDNVDLGAATRAGIVVMNTPDGNATTAAEHTIALMMSLVRMIPLASASMKAGQWEKKKFMGHELCHKTLGVLGLGNIGRIVADRAAGLKMHVLGFDPYFEPTAAGKLGVELVPFEELLRRSDVITVHTPLTAETRGLIGAKQLEICKKGVFLVNCARGGIIEEAALLAALDSGKVGGAALDVFTKEPPPKDDKLVAHERIVSTPHLGASTVEAQVQVSVDIARQVLAFARGEPAQNAVNLPRAAPGELQLLGPYVDLARRMGQFCAQLTGGPLSRVEVEYWGDVLGHPLAAITQGALAGALHGVIEGVVNTVNARLLAEERGITLAEVKNTKAQSAHATGLRVTVVGKETHSLAGTLVEGQEARVIALDGIALDAAPEGHILVLRNADKPGMIGHIGTLLGGAGINIANMHMGRDRDAGEHVTLVNIDEPASPELLVRLGGGGVTFVRQVTL